MEPNWSVEAGDLVTPELAPEDRARVEQWLGEHPFGDQDENGIDLSLLRENLKLTPTERVEKMLRGQALIKELKNAGRSA